jgi:hypothetical protein
MRGVPKNVSKVIIHHPTQVRRAPEGLRVRVRHARRCVPWCHACVCLCACARVCVCARVHNHGACVTSLRV